MNNNDDSIGRGILFAMFLSMIGSAFAFGAFGFGSACFFWAAFYGVGAILTGIEGRKK